MIKQTYLGQAVKYSVAGIVAPLIIVGASYLGGCNLFQSNSDKGLERKISEPIPVQSVPRVQSVPEKRIEPVIKQKQTHKYSYLDIYDDIIKQNVDDFNKRLNPKTPLEYNLVKAMIITESGNPLHRKTAFKYDPMQIANKGDYALDVLVEGKENSHLIGDFSKFKGKTHTPWKNGKWDYTNSNMTAKDSIELGIGWLGSKASEEGYVEYGKVIEYTVKQGDSFWKIEKEQGTSSDIMRKYNPNVEPRDIMPGNKLKFRKAKLDIIKWDWYSGVWGYNGALGYAEKAYQIKAELDKFDELEVK